MELFGRTSSAAIRDWFRSIHDGSRRRGGLCRWDSSTSWMESTTCLFLLCLVIPFRRFRPLVLVVTAFTVAHSITLIASAFNFAPDALWFPPLDRDADRGIHRLHGAREHRGRQSRTGAVG